MRATARGRLVLALALAGALAVAGGLLWLPRGRSTASALPPFPPVEATTPQADGSAPAGGITMIAGTPEEPGAAADEVWGIGKRGATSVLVRFSGTGAEGGWSLGPALPEGFAPNPMPLAGAMIPDGAGALVGTITSGSEAHEVLLVREPGKPFAEVPLPAGEEALFDPKSESIDPTTREPLVAALHEGDGAAGALVVPVNEKSEEEVESQVLHWDGHEWQKEQIEGVGARTDFRVLAISAAAPGSAWLLAELASKADGGLGLFKRVQVEPQHWVWKPVSTSGGEATEAQPLTVPLSGGGEPRLTLSGTGNPPSVRAQALEATPSGLWVHGERGDLPGGEAAGTLLYLTAEGEADARIRASWCQEDGTEHCTHPLPTALPSGYSRIVAWEPHSEAEPYGAMVLTGLREGISLRLQGAEIHDVLSLGGGKTGEDDPGAQLGAAFASPSEGWLGRSLLPIHLTEHPVGSRLTPWPVPFRAPLFAIQPQPGQPVGALSSEALAVGANGEVARYRPGPAGVPGAWLPESLFGPGERVERGVNLRALSWPRQERAYAVGDHGQMWLYRGEIGRWEKDPATPPNLRANLLGVAFDPNNPARGYAVGTKEVGLGGVLLRYGKTWTEEAELPAAAAGGAFTAIAFAGSEALVVYRRQPDPAVSVFRGGVLVNDGAGWQVDEAATEALGTALPVTVAALPDGGAAIVAQSSGGRILLEREAAGAPWHSTPIPAADRGGSLSLFREGGALRAVLAGGGVGNLEFAGTPPPGFPPPIYEPIGSNSTPVETAVVARQTASGWSDETHELDPTKDPEGNYEGAYDAPYRPDPIQAVLIDPTGAEGWAVGGVIGARGEATLSETADVERYPDGSKPPSLQEAPVSLSASAAAVGEAVCEGQCATLAVGGHAVCQDPCAVRSRTGVGPQVWLSAALSLTRRLGVRTFLDTGPSLPAGRTPSAPVVPYPFARELESTERVLGEGAAGEALHVYVTPSAQDRAARPESEGTEALFASELHEYLGAEVATRAACTEAVGCEGAYYEARTADGVHVLVLDESLRVASSEQLGWLQERLSVAAEAHEPAIVLGDARLAGESWAKPLIAVIAGGEGCSPKARSSCASASAYFYDAPEEDARGTLTAGAASVPEFGSGTLGYETAETELKSDFHGASGILLAQVELKSPSAGGAGVARDPVTNRFPVYARLIPVISELAIEAKGGTLLRRSNPALFSGLARRPRAGGNAEEETDESFTAPYIPIPEECVGTACAAGMFPEYSFSSSRPDVGDFVARNTASANPLAVLQNETGEPVADPHSGLFCPFNAGTTVVTIEAGGYRAELPVTVQKGSVREPCGTVPLKEPPAKAESVAPPPAPAPAPASSTPPASTPPPVPVPPLPAAPPARVAKPQVPFVPLAGVGAPVLAFVPPPVPTPARPTPPSGTSAVTSPVEVAEEEEEREEAPEQVSAKAVAYDPAEHEPAPLYVLGIVALAALAGAAIRRPRRGDREIRVAAATVNVSRSQRRLERESRRRR